MIIWEFPLTLKSELTIQKIRVHQILIVLYGIPNESIEAHVKIENNEITWP